MNRSEEPYNVVMRRLAESVMRDESLTELAINDGELRRVIACYIGELPPRILAGMTLLVLDWQGV